MDKSGVSVSSATVSFCSEKWYGLAWDEIVGKDKEAVMKAVIDIEMNKVRARQLKLDETQVMEMCLN